MNDFIVESNAFTEKLGPEFWPQWFMGIIAPVLSIIANM
ncbi:hypothetical protein [Edwardsiella phage PEi26]|uniref:Uncharacterized protein n=1 Tax=Edwardsiella phage PEi26 TaxID=1608311 RepID=A0A0B6VRF6_9CAUD|nr:hypothetical protein [Edwardsiella phage PEi26]